eukprot:GHVT01094888.1.p1 GENE.GHVT01094888.1~~GHVT01094888.1.p1  ORF type:complete len:127 (-),score=6.61 GHVT01094888.1:29-409(-)
MAAARNVGQPRLEVKESDSRRDQPPDSKLVQQLVRTFKFQATFLSNCQCLIALLFLPLLGSFPLALPTSPLLRYLSASSLLRFLSFLFSIWFRRARQGVHWDIIQPTPLRVDFLCANLFPSGFRFS